ncbi:hypothetical protein DP73_04465 [Desulfosporosinus sp. HMP52]|nr:hypothetical protein DP73_04465 [Desulfosporosinus sp. HMP52]
MLGISSANVEVTDENALNEIEKAYCLLKSLKDQKVALSNFSVHYKNKTMTLNSQDIDSIHEVNNLKNHLVDYR